MLVVVIALEWFLDGISPQLSLALLHRVSILPFLVINVILIKIVYMDVWNVLRLHSSSAQCIPVEVFEPWMAFQFRRTFRVANSILWFPLQAFIDEICSFNGPAFGDFVALNLHLLA